MSSFFDNLVYLRQKNGMSQQDLADRSGCSRSAIGMYETGKREPDIETLEAFADIFNVDMDFLTGRGASRVPVVSGERKELIDIIPLLPDDIVHALLTIANQVEQQR